MFLFYFIYEPNVLFTITIDTILLFSYDGGLVFIFVNIELCALYASDRVRGP